MQSLTLQLSAEFPAAPVRPTARACVVAALFGLPLDSAPRVVFPAFDFVLRPATLTLITGPSGSGKSTLLAAMEKELLGQGATVMRLGEIALPGDLPVVDCFDSPLEQALGHLARAGLSEAHTLLRAPAELSEGQQFRYRVAQFFASPAEVLLADEFAATLDRITAKLLSWQLQKFIRQSFRTPHPKAAILATTHHDLPGDLLPDTHIYKGLGDDIRITHR